MNLKNDLQKNKYVKSVNFLDFSDAIKITKDIKSQQKIKRWLKSVEVYRFLYKVNSIDVVGYVSVPKQGDNLPCLIHLRGGVHKFSMLEESSILEKLVRFSVEGYIVISTQYPGVEGGGGVDAFGGFEDIESILKLKDVLKSITVADSTKIGVKGHSRGGLMGYMLLRKVKWIKAAVIGAAPVDQIRQAKERDGWRKHQIYFWGKSREESIKRSPLRWVDDLPTTVPILMVHGSADWRVNPLDSIEMSKSMYQRKIPHRFILFEGADHGITEYKDEYFKQTLDWFNRFLKNKEIIPNLDFHGD